MHHINLGYKCLQGAWIQTSGSWENQLQSSGSIKDTDPSFAAVVVPGAGDIKRLNGMRCHYQQGNNTPFSLPRLNGSHPSLPLPACRQFTYHHSPRCIPHNNPWIQHTHSNTTTHRGFLSLPFEFLTPQSTLTWHTHLPSGQSSPNSSYSIDALVAKESDVAKNEVSTTGTVPHYCAKLWQEAQ